MQVKKELVKKPPIETASWCYRGDLKAVLWFFNLIIPDKEDDVHHDFAWTITNFSRKINMVPNGEYIESDKFSVTAHGMDLEWQLCLYPSGKDCEDEEHVSILLELVSRSLTATFSGKIEFSVVSTNGEKVFRKKKSIKESDTQIGRPMFGLLAAKFIPHNLLRLDQQNNQITPDDKLTVLCEITIDGKDVQQSGQAQVIFEVWPKYCSKMWNVISSPDIILSLSQSPNQAARFVLRNSQLILTSFSSLASSVTSQSGWFLPMPFPDASFDLQVWEPPPQLSQNYPGGKVSCLQCNVHSQYDREVVQKTRLFHQWVNVTISFSSQKKQVDIEDLDIETVKDMLK